MQIQNTKVPKNLEVFEKYNNFRKNFFINWMKNKVDSMLNKDMYGDFNKSKK